MGGVSVDIARTLEQAGSGPITLRARPNCTIIYDEPGAWYSVADEVGTKARAPWWRGSVSRVGR
eukprot:7557389-Alexandrium_andersonii.AAC.1